MNMTNDQAKELVRNVQVAHRLSVGFYQRLLPMVAGLARQLDLEFWYWEPMHTSRPGASTTEPDRKWKWDMLPLFASRHVYRKVVGGPAQPGDRAVMFDIYVDDAFKPEDRKARGIRGEPDPLALRDGDAVVQTSLFRCITSSDETFDQIWKSAGAVNEVSPDWRSVHAQLHGRMLRHDLAKFISQPDMVVAEIKAADPSIDLSA